MIAKINRTSFLTMACLCFFFLCGCVSDPEPVTEKSNKRPNIILLLTDDQRNDTLGCAGHPIVQTPNIDKLAARGVRFENCFVTLGDLVNKSFLIVFLTVVVIHPNQFLSK